MSPEDRFEAYFKDHYAFLCRGVNRILRDPDLSEDLVQNVFLKIWQKRNQLEFDDRFIFYLKKACFHEALQQLKAPTLTIAENHQPDISDQKLSDENLMTQELQQKVLAGIKLLPERSRLVFTLARYEEMTYKEIAAELNISIKGVEKHMTKSLKLLRIHLQEYLSLLLFYIFF